MVLLDECGDTPFERFTKDVYLRILEMSRKNRKRESYEIKVNGPSRKLLSRSINADLFTYEQDGKEYGEAHIIDHSPESNLYTILFIPRKDFEESVSRQTVPEARSLDARINSCQGRRKYVRRANNPKYHFRKEGSPRQTRGFS